jgi:lipopolysaccharide transport system permease protein
MFVSRAHVLEVFFTKLVLNLKSEASKTYLSFAWWLIEPALQVAVFYVVFGIFLGRGNVDFVVFLVCGIVPFGWLEKSLKNAAGSITAGAGLINQASVPKPLFPMLVVFQDAFKQMIVFSFMFVFLLANGMEVSWVSPTVVFVMLTQLLVVSAGALLVSAITPFLPDFRFLISTLMMALLFGSGIFYSYKDVITSDYERLFLLNPVATLIKNYRHVLMDNEVPDWSALALICFFSILVILIMNRYYRKTDTLYARLINQ